VLRWTRRRELRAFRLPGGAIRYHPDELASWLEQRATPGREELSRTPQGAAHWQPSAYGGTLTAVTHPEGEED
jgi:hypothetical protein